MQQNVQRGLWVAWWNVWTKSAQFFTLPIQQPHDLALKIPGVQKSTLDRETTRLKKRHWHIHLEHPGQSAMSERRINTSTISMTI
jgi:hypothetical protein